MMRVATITLVVLGWTLFCLDRVRATRTHRELAGWVLLAIGGHITIMAAVVAVSP